MSIAIYHRCPCLLMALQIFVTSRHNPHTSHQFKFLPPTYSSKTGSMSISRISAFLAVPKKVMNLSTRTYIYNISFGPHFKDVIVVDDQNEENFIHCCPPFSEYFERDARSVFFLFLWFASISAFSLSEAM